MLHSRMGFAGVLAVVSMWIGTAVWAAEDTKAEIEALKKEVAKLTKKADGFSSAPASKSAVDKALGGKYGPDSAVSTKAGKLTIGGLLQVWYYTIQQDHNGLFNDPLVNGIADTNEGQDNSSFRVRRAELKFTMDIHENIQAIVMIDPAREAGSFPNVTSNQGVIKRRNNVAPEFADANGTAGSVANITSVQTGAGAAPTLLQDAYIVYHGVVPHHNFMVGQFHAVIGEEAVRSDAQLDFIERSLVGQLSDARVMGAAIHGTWWENRFQYWGVIHNGQGNYYGSAGGYSNRSDDNDNKDFNYRMLVRPLWQNETWGSLELGMSSNMGIHGESSGHDPVNTPVNGLNRKQTWAMHHDAWFSYMPGGPVRGWWIRGEWAYIRDRNAPNAVVDLLGAGGSASGFEQVTGRAFSSQGWYIGTGYKLSDSQFKDSLPGWLKPWEFAFRWDTFENVQVADLVNPDHTDNFRTDIYTFGVNYYIKGHNAKIQANYNISDEPHGAANGANRKFHEVRNDSFVVNFQVAF